MTAAVGRDQAQDPHRWWMLAAVCLATFMLFLDLTVVNVALPSIRADLDASFDDLQWVIDAYALGLAAFLLTAGSIADRVGRRRLFSIGLLVFTLASAGCGLAGAPAVLNIARGGQGLGAAIMYAVGPAMIAASFRGRQRGTAFGVFGAVSGVAIAAGPLLGGVLTEVDWRWVFFLNIPLGVLALVVVATRVRESTKPAARRVDYPGVVLFSSALLALVYGIIRGPVEGWTSLSAVGMIAAAVVLLAAFAVVQLRSRAPMFDVALFGNRSFAGLSAATFLINFSVNAVILFAVLWMQGVLELSAIETGVRFLPLTVVLLVAGAVGGVLSARVPISALIGTSLLCTGIGLLLMRWADPGSSWLVLLPAFIVAGIGMGLHNPPRANASVALVPAEDAGMGSGINETFQQAGSALGVAVLGAVAHAVIVAGLSSGIRDLPADSAQLDAAADAVAVGALASLPERFPPDAADAVAATAEMAFVDAFDTVVTVGGLVTLVGALLAYWLIRRKDFVLDPAAPETEPSEEVGDDQGGSAPNADGRKRADRRKHELV
ncbi:EmrB/QacA subfamily drug resistance transporter [Nocardia tenerifensis]|uniref:EmrB/QacA subfamily drug resistance transporter n=1 Tax=Nocardia tenerifensis TaxID=228006 RepID=A0A318KXL3_9NOCA|nr:MFS transporter [Nocardia tenerifensis]PXX70664.1 EmrB/QacA subfamily drug resistance transporter [Nocardia tenerifensis]